ncbi:MAG: 2-oxo acid dehydrogenase subunit E2 [Euryarchaeota archaeon]|nr:MAG: pyruvate/2-oxoglutarate/2-oxoisovalerate dehydrogenase E2 component [uncultured Candidatus Poseidoniales archaeon]MBT3452288.1 2-oxo acid dehydrogenase subunit E2 [Euryarchaeota archaeon]MDA8615251.1 2-oxo acid dehydrogenase subunit E2 [Candidatus Poseidoniales archaeon]MBT5121809.1 2-oxo acid dehydrogenase subunit E2 [Euryarchaeota archaeon]MBT5618948.1 2-oxo acid dehydrogenase subunit E2 [Euryarchaeota archaeon]
MGTFAFKMPDIGEGVVEGEVVEWMVAVGDTVKEDDPILSVMTDKATVEIPSPVDGTVTKVVGEAGDILPVGVVCIEFEVDGAGNASASDDAPAAKEAPAPAAKESKPEPTPEVAPAPTPAPKAAATPAPAAAPVARAPGTKALASPAVRQRAREANISLDHVAGSGPAGRISHADLDAHIAGGASGASRAAPMGGRARTELNGTESMKVIGLRRKIADSMIASYSSIPHFSYFEEVDVTALEELRQHLNATRPEGAPKLTYLPFIMQALVKALAQRPECNALYDDEANVVTRHEAINLGIATQTDRGLFVPVVKHVEAMDIWQSATEMGRVTGATRDGKAGVEDLTGSTFTITSLGRLGGLGATPIINKPEVGILGVHNAKDRAVVRDGAVVIRRMMNLSSSWDHRVVDGHDGATLVQLVKTYLENPATIFM